MAALLAIDDGAALSHRAAAAVWDLRPIPAGEIDVTIPSRNGRKKRAGIRLHRSSTLSPADAVVHDGLPVTSVPRTILDLADVLSRRELERTLDRSEQRPNTPQAQLSPRASSRNAFWSSWTGPASSAPRSTKGVVLQDGSALRPDCMWTGRRLIVELDGFRAHSGREAMRSDRRRDRKLRLEDWTVLRFTYDDVTRDPAGVIAELHAHTS